MKLVLLDNMILAWGIAGDASAGQDQMVQIAKSYLDNVDREGTRAAVPAPALAEFLVEVEGSRHARTLAAISRRFPIFDLDAKAAVKAAEVTSANLKHARDKHGPQPGLRAALKVDAMIIGIALSRGVRTIISHDPGMRTMAEGFAAVEVTEIPHQGLFDPRMPPSSG